MGKREREDKSAASSNAVASAKPRRNSVGSSQNASSSKLLSGNSAAKPSVSASASKSSAASSASAKPSAQMSFEDLLKDISSSSDTALVSKASAVTSERKKDTEQQKTKQNSHANTPAASAAAAGAGKAKAQAPSAGASAAPAKLAPKQKVGKSKAPVFKGGFDSDEEGGGDDAAVDSSDDAEDDDEDDEEVDDDADGDDDDADGSDDEEEEEEDEEDDDAALLDESTGGLSINQHKKQLEKLKESDPKFYAYLQKTSANLLSFGEGEADAEEGEEDEEEEEAGDDHEAGDDDEEDEGEPMEEGDGGRKRKGPHEQETLTAESAKSILAQAFEAKTWRGLVRACQAFRAACYSGDSADVLSRLGLASSGGSGYGKSKKNKDRSGGNEKGKAKVSAAEAAEGEMNKLKALRFRVNSSKVFMMVVQEVLTKGGAAFAHHMGAPRGQKQQQKQAAGAGGGAADAAAEADDGIDINGINTRIPLSDYPGYTKVAQLAKGLLMCTVHLLSQTTEPSFITFTLRSLRSFIPYLQGQGALTKKVLRSLLSLFGSHENAGVRLQAYMRVRQAAVVLPYPTIDLCLKGCYMAFVRGAKFMTESGASNILLTANCVAELYGIDDTASYQHAFIYLRQLAIHLRTALTTQSKEAAANVLSWSFVNCLRLWSSVLVRHGSDTSRPLFLLLYPLVQVINGVLRMQPSPRYYPMRLHLVSCLNDMAWASGVYIPTSPLLIDILRSPSLSTKPKGAAPANPPLLSLMVKVGKTTLATRSYQDALASRTFELLLDSLKVNYCSVAFPELIVPVAGALRSFAKETRVGAWRSRAKALLDAINGQAAKIAQKRATLNAAPGDRASIAAFMQAEGAALRAERSKGREAAAKELVQQAQDAAVAAANAAANAEAASKKQRQQQKRNAKDSDDDSDDESGDDDEEEDEEESDFDGSGAEDDDEDDEEGSEEEAEEEEERPAKRAAAAAPAGTKKLAAAAAAAAASKSTKASAKGGKKAMLPVVAGDDVVEDFDLSDLE